LEVRVPRQRHLRSSFPKNGFTLIELLVTAIIVGILTMALASAFAYGATFQNRSEASRQAELARIQFEDRVRELLTNATITTDATDTSSFFLAGADAAGADDRLTFTTEIPRVSGAQADSTDDFQTQNQEFGPRGGLEEVSMSLTPVGQAPQDSGIFIREQRPSDGDSTQGGYESSLDPDVTSIQWEFFDGVNWDTTWDSTTATRRIPAAVRVTYQLQNEQNPRVFVVRLKNSDVTPTNPVTQAAGGG
jgi:prepilin-type N-terminal cleavage/methylation domain-containing protein